MPERISAIPACPQPFPASQGSFGLTADPQEWIIPLDPSVLQAMENLASVFLCICWSSTRQKSLDFTLYKSTPGVVSGQSRTFMSEETCVYPKTCVVFAGCGCTPWSRTHVRLNGKGQSPLWLLADLSVGKYLEGALPGEASTACSSWKGLLCIL